jgi:Family of unknown function (DUF6152)
VLVIIFDRFAGEESTITNVVSVAAGAALLIAIAVTPARAHHSFAAEFDAKRPVKLRGTVVKMEWINPDEILVEGFQAKDGANRANGRDITFPDGKKLFVGSSGTGAPDERPEK